MSMWYATETFTDEEREILAPHVSDLDGPVFALTNLPEAVKGALFARYSRSTKSLRRLFLDEFAADVAGGGDVVSIGSERAEKLYDRVFVEYGDDSVAQLGGVHLACEQSSQLLAKALEWGRLAAYLEQSTRYMRYDGRPGDRWRATVPPEIIDTQLEDRYVGFLDEVFGAYGRMFDALDPWYRDRFPQQPGDSNFVYNQTILAKTCDTLRMILAAGTRSNLGIYATGQSYEQLLMRLAQHPLAEMREYGELMKVELRKVIPEFLKRVDVEDRGVAWSAYWRDVRERTQELAAKLTGDIAAEPREEVNLVDHDPDGELKVTAAVLYAEGELPDDQLLELVRRMPEGERAAVLAASVGARTNRRHKPGRAWERTQYRFDVLCDYGAFRDLQRHRPLTIEWQRLTPAFGYDVPLDVEEAGLRDEWIRVMDRSKETHDQIAAGGLLDAAQYAVSMAFRIRFVLQMTAREAMHMAELRSQPQGHPTYRRVAQAIHREVARVHPAIGEAFTFMSNDDVDLERLEAERRTERKRGAVEPA
jgi:thymidylate synthase ThyX